MSSAPTPQQALTPENQEKLATLLRAIPAWFTAPFKSIFLACITAVQLIIYMAMHWAVGRFFGDFIAKDFPQMRRYLDVLSSGVFFYLIVKSLGDLVWENLPNFKPLRKTNDNMKKEQQP